MHNRLNTAKIKHSLNTPIVSSVVAFIKFMEILNRNIDENPNLTDYLDMVTSAQRELVEQQGLNLHIDLAGERDSLTVIFPLDTRFLGMRTLLNLSPRGLICYDGINISVTGNQDGITISSTSAAGVDYRDTRFGGVHRPSGRDDILLHTICERGGSTHKLSFDHLYHDESGVYLKSSEVLPRVLSCLKSGGYAINAEVADYNKISAFHVIEYISNDLNIDVVDPNKHTSWRLKFYHEGTQEARTIEFSREIEWDEEKSAIDEYISYQCDFQEEFHGSNLSVNDFISCLNKALI